MSDGTEPTELRSSLESMAKINQETISALAIFKSDLEYVVEGKSSAEEKETQKESRSPTISSLQDDARLIKSLTDDCNKLFYKLRFGK